MRNKLRVLSVLLIGLLLVGLLYLVLDTRRMNSDNLLLVAPKAFHLGKINREALERINGESFLFTYEILSYEHLRTLNEKHEVTLRKTNYAYPFVMGHKLLKGSFFSAQDQNQNKKTAVLNKRAAYDLFGNMDICGTEIQILHETFKITGVIEDHCEAENNIYLPASSSGDEPTEVVVFLDEALSVMKVKNALKSVLSEDQYDFVAFGKLGRLIYELCVSGVKLVGVGILLMLLIPCLSSLKERFLYLKQLAKSFYCRELFQNYGKEVLAVILLSLSVVLVSSVIIVLIASLMEFVWTWSEGAPLLNLQLVSSFNWILSDLKTKILLSWLFMVGLTVNVVFFLMASIRIRY